VLKGEQVVPPGTNDVLVYQDVDRMFPVPGSTMEENANLLAKAAFFDPIYSAEANVLIFFSVTICLILSKTNYRLFDVLFCKVILSNMI